MPTPIFIFSLPRSGSTLLQRLLMGSGECATLGEPSLLLRFLGDSNRVARYSNYRECNVEISIRDIRAQWNGFDEAYQSGINRLMSDIYANLSGGKRYFIDKTPRYTLIAQEILETFPDAKFLVLWRHPLAVAASISESFHGGHWHFDDFNIDLTTGLQRLHDFEEANADRVCSIRYEDVVNDPASSLAKIGAYLEIDNLQDIASKELLKQTGGMLGDPTGINKYARISTQSCDAWVQVYRNWYRQRWARNYFDNPRSGWLRERGYELPDEVLKPRSKAYVDGFKEMRCMKRKNKSRERRFVRIMQRDHVWHLP